MAVRTRSLTIVASHRFREKFERSSNHLWRYKREKCRRLGWSLIDERLFGGGNGVSIGHLGPFRYHIWGIRVFQPDVGNMSGLWLPPCHRSTEAVVRLLILSMLRRYGLLRRDACRSS